VLNDDTSAFIIEIVSADKFLSDAFRELCAIHLRIGPVFSPGFARRYPGAGQRLHDAIQALADYIDTTAVTIIVSQTYTVGVDEMEIPGDTPLWRLTDECDNALEAFVERYGAQGLDEFLLIWFVALRLPFASAMIWTLLGDQCLLVGVNAAQTGSLPHAQAVNYMVAAHFGYIFAEQALLGALDGLRHLMGQLSDIYDRSVRPVGQSFGRPAGVTLWAGLIGGRSHRRSVPVSMPSKDEFLAPYRASEQRLYEVIDAVRRRLALFEREAEV